MVTIGAENAGYQPLVAGLDGAAPTSVEALEALLPADRSYFTYDGSLTTLPCTEGVRWIVLKNPVMLSEAQIIAFAEVNHGPTNRPVQELHGRAVRMSN